VTKLVRNYRSHPTILDLSSELLYEGELVACKHGESAAYDCIGLPNRSFPVLFSGMPVNKENHLLMIALTFLTGHSLFFFWLEIKDGMSGRAPVHHGSTGLKLVK
jgi:hypothetical protein